MRTAPLVRWWASGLVVLVAVGCLQPMPLDQPCREAGYAIARRTLECTGDADLANSRYEAFDQQYMCIDADYRSDADSGDTLKARDLFDCAFSIGELACELVDAYGDDLDAWLQTSDACAYIVEKKEGGR